ncbi:aldehyde dehydrogenase family protein, partial [Flavihumibacter sediminis]|nr:aldehyde dehydrogenase family protein [Flavihumibacter sediminis]
MSANTTQLKDWYGYVAGEKVVSDTFHEVKSPYDNRVVGRVVLAGKKDGERAIEKALAGGKKLNRYDRYTIIDRTRLLLVERKEEFAHLISA